LTSSAGLSHGLTVGITLSQALPLAPGQSCLRPSSQHKPKSPTPLFPATKTLT
jgi:hypothetical protein